MYSSRKLAQQSRGARSFQNPVHNVIIPALLEISHALGRGRRPTTCSVIPGKDVQKWLREMYTVPEERMFDHALGKCSYADDLESILRWSPPSTPSTFAILTAIARCRSYMRPPKKAVRGDPQYQQRNRLTNLKKKEDFRLCNIV